MFHLPFPEWILGFLLSTMASLLGCLGLTMQKLTHKQIAIVRERTFKEMQAAKKGHARTNSGENGGSAPLLSADGFPMSRPRQGTVGSTISEGDERDDGDKTPRATAARLSTSVNSLAGSLLNAADVNELKGSSPFPDAERQKLEATVNAYPESPHRSRNGDAPNNPDAAPDIPGRANSNPPAIQRGGSVLMDPESKLEDPPSSAPVLNDNEPAHKDEEKDTATVRVMVEEDSVSKPVVRQSSPVSAPNGSPQDGYLRVPSSPSATSVDENKTRDTSVTPLRVETLEEDDDEITIQNVAKEGYCMKPMWIFGFAINILGALLDVVAFGFAPASMIAPLASLTLVFNTVLAPKILGERLNWRDRVAALLICGGTAIIVVFANQDTPQYTAHSLRALYLRYAVLYYVIIVSSIAIFCFAVAARFGDCQNPASPQPKGLESTLLARLLGY